jgi:hypothetical protein
MAEPKKRQRVAPQRPWFNLAGGAGYVGCHPETLRQYAQEGKVKFSRVGSSTRGELRFHESWLDDLIESQAVEPREHVQ